MKGIVNTAKFRELTDKLADVIGEMRAYAANDPSVVLAMMDHVLNGPSGRWSPVADYSERPSDARGMMGVLQLVVTLAVRR